MDIDQYLLLFFNHWMVYLNPRNCNVRGGSIFSTAIVGAPFFSGYLGISLLIYTRQITMPHRPISIRWLSLGAFGTIHSILERTIPNGLDPAIRSIIDKEPYWHPILSNIMIIHGIQLITFIVLSTFFITRAFWKKSRPDLRRTQFWLVVICWTCLVTMVFTNIVPTFKIIITEIEPAFFMFPVAIVCLLSIKSLGEETKKISKSDSATY